MTKYLITIELAKLAKKYGYSNGTNNIFSETLNKDCQDDHGNLIPINTISFSKQFYNSNSFRNNNDFWAYYEAPTYSELIDWIFEIVYFKGGKTKQESVEWLKLWYHNSKNPSSKYEFNGRLLKWLRDNNVVLTINNIDNDCKFNANVTNLKGEIILDGFTLFDTYEKALDEGITEILNNITIK